MLGSDLKQKILEILSRSGERKLINVSGGRSFDLKHLLVFLFPQMLPDPLSICCNFSMYVISDLMLTDISQVFIDDFCSCLLRLCSLPDNLCQIVIHPPLDQTFNLAWFKPLFSLGISTLELKWSCVFWSSVASFYNQMQMTGEICYSTTGGPFK